jgi:putative transcriptional regulator
MVFVESPQFTRAITELMNKRAFQELAESVRWMGKHMRGEAKTSRVFEFPTPDVQAIRKKTGLSQAEFAGMIRVSIKTLQNWEQKRRSPTGPAAALLHIVAKEPQTAVKALHAR